MISLKTSKVLMIFHMMLIKTLIFNYGIKKSTGFPQLGNFCFNYVVRGLGVKYL